MPCHYIATCWAELRDYKLIINLIRFATKLPKGVLAKMGLLGIFSLPMFLFNSFYTVSESEKIMVFRFGEHIETTTSGLHFRVPIMDKLLRTDVESVEELEFSDTLLTLDENLIIADFSVQYKVFDPFAFHVLNRDSVKQLKLQAESASRAVIADFSMDDAITTRREDVKMAIEEKLADIMNNILELGIEVVAINYVSGQPPEEVKAAFDDAIQAREDAESYINDANAYKEYLLPNARGIAEKTVNEARSFREQVVNKAKGDVQGFEKLLPEYEKNPELTTSRIYYDTVSNVIGNNTVIINDNKTTIPPIQTLDLNKLVPAIKGQ